MFALSGGVLWELGLNYDGVTGSAASKVHPSSYLVVLLFGWAAVASGNPVGYGIRAARRRPASLLMLVAGVALMVQIAVRGSTGLAGTIDTWMAPALLTTLILDLDEDGVRQAEIVLHIVMSINGLLGLYEFLTSNILFPYRFDGEVFINDTRSAALQGHPLTNAAVTAVYLLSLLAGGGNCLSVVLRVALIVLQSAALVTFGGRSASVITLVLGSAYALAFAHRVLKRGRVPLIGAAAALIVLAIGPIAIVAIAAAGFFDKLSARFISDGGSAEARVQMFDLFDRLTFRDLLFGPDPSLVDSLRRASGLEWGVENPIVSLLLYQGISMTALIVVAFSLFMVEIARNTRRGNFMTIMGFVLLLNTSESVAVKTTTLSKFVVTMLVLFPIRQGQSLGRVNPSASTMEGSKARVTSSMMPIPSNRFQNAQAKPDASAVRRTSRT
jgi:hypothetical protein